MPSELTPLVHSPSPDARLPSPTGWRVCLEGWNTPTCAHGCSTRQKPPLGWPRETDSLCPTCTREARQEILDGKKDVSVFIMHPKGKVSPIQEAQMTTVLDANVHNIAVEGTFDDCQVY